MKFKWMVDVEGPWNEKWLDALCVMLEERLDCMMGVCGSNISSDKGNASSQNDADRHWNSHIIKANDYRR